MSKRTDPHRPSAIVPAEYRYVLSYILPTPNFPGWRVEDVAHLRGQGKKFSELGGLGKCTVCGANYVYGDVWLHVPTQEHVHVGHDCADKYDMLASRSAFELEKSRRDKARAAAIAADDTRARKAAFLAANPGLAEAFEVNHRIISDIAAQFNRKDLSSKQVALVLKIAAEERAPKVEEAHIPAPIGKCEVQGTVVSAKYHEGAYAETLKMVVKVETPNGSWLAWGTIPTTLVAALDAIRDPHGPNCGIKDLKGKVVKFTATLKPGREPHFAFFSRPTKATIVNAEPFNHVPAHEGPWAVEVRYDDFVQAYYCLVTGPNPNAGALPTGKWSHTVEGALEQAQERIELLQGFHCERCALRENFGKTNQEERKAS